MELIVLIVLGILGYASLSGRILRIEERLNNLPHSDSILDSKPAEQFSIEERKDEMPEISSEKPLITTPSDFPLPKPFIPFTDFDKPETENGESLVFNKTSDPELEFKFGSKIFTVIGAIAVMFGLGFFLRYAFENDLINEPMRVILGLLGGGIFLGLGEFTRRKYNLYGQMLTGLGVGVFYLSIYAAINFYHLISTPFAFVGMIVVTILGVALAVWNDSMPLAALAQFGGLITPVLLSTGENSPHALFSYIALLNIGILAIAYWKIWRHLFVLGFIGTAIHFLVWFSTFYTPEQLLIAIGYASLFFLIFFGVLIMQLIMKRTTQDEVDLTLTTANSVAYFLMSYFIINPTYHELMGLFTTILAILHLSVGFVISATDESSKKFHYFLIAIGLVLLVLAVPIQFEKNWITIGWATEGLVLTFLGFLMKSKYLRHFAFGVFMLSFIRLIFVDGALHSTTPWLNDRMLAYLLSILFMSVASGLYYYNKNNLEEDEGILLSFVPLLPACLLISGVTLEINDFFGKYWLSVSWSLIGLLIGIIALSLKNFLLRILGLLALAATFFRIITVDANLHLQTAWINERTFVFLVAIFAGAVFAILYNLFRESTTQNEYDVTFSSLLLYVYVLTLWGFTSEVLSFYPEKDYWLPVIWSTGGLLGGLSALFFRNIYLQLAVCVSFIMATMHLLLVEGSVNLENYTPLLNSRAFAFLVVIITGGIFVYIFQQFNDFLNTEYQKNIKNGFYSAISFLVLFLISVEVLDFFNKQFHDLSSEEKSGQEVSYDNRKRAALSVAWTVYSLILLVLGIIKKAKLTRLFGIALLGVTIFKVFLYDIANLDDFYRFISYLSLGLILLLIGYLYNRFKSRITEFIIAEE